MLLLIVAVSTAQVDGDSILIIDSASYPESPGASPGNDQIIQDVSAQGPVVFRSVPDSVSNKLKSSRDFEYANDPAYWVRPTPEELSSSRGFWETLAAFFARPAVQAFVYLAIIAGLLFLLIRVVIINRLFIFRRSAASKVGTAIAESDEKVMTGNLEPRIADAIAAGDHRSAVRFLYLKTLQLLDKKGWITFHPRTTNNQYRQQANAYARGREFGFLSTIYEHVYYGNFQMTPEQFKTVLHNFNHFHNSLRV